MSAANPFIGEIYRFPGNFAPVGWAFCDGSLLPISQYQALFALIGTFYGGNGTNQFCAPGPAGPRSNPLRNQPVERLFLCPRTNRREPNDGSPERPAPASSPRGQRERRLHCRKPGERRLVHRSIRQ